MVEVTYHQQKHQINYKNTTPGVFFTVENLQSKVMKYKLFIVLHKK